MSILDKKAGWLECLAFIQENAKPGISDHEAKVLTAEADRRYQTIVATQPVEWVGTQHKGRRFRRRVIGQGRECLEYRDTEPELGPWIQVPWPKEGLFFRTLTLLPFQEHAADQDLPLVEIQK